MTSQPTDETIEPAPVRQSETATRRLAAVAPYAQACTRARETMPIGTRVTAVVLGVAALVGQLTRHWAGQGKATVDRLTTSKFAELHPASVREMRGYIDSADWVPGDVPALELAGKVYGYLVAIPVSVLLYAVGFVIQRPGRFLFTAAAAAIVVLCIVLG